MANDITETPAAPLAVIGLGYVGLPLAVAFGRIRPVIGFDIAKARVAALGEGYDDTGEIAPEALAQAHQLHLSSDAADLAPCSIYIITVPTPIDRHCRPDLSALLEASEIVGRVLSTGDIVIYESTVYPGATEEDCVPILERSSSLVLNRDFFVGYSPERVNPGDRAHRLADICKVTSGSTPQTAEHVDALYRTIITAGTYRAESIRVAEAAKVIENTQRDLNIALVNELAIIFNRLGLDTQSVLRAAATKWNFLPFQPGLVGGHCIGIDPYYLAHKAQESGYYPEIILAGRRLNDTMSGYVATQMVKTMLARGVRVAGGRVLVMGLTFKENCRDLRNSKAMYVIKELQGFGLAVDVYDPQADAAQARAYGYDLLACPSCDTYDGILIAVGHDAFRALAPAVIRQYGRADCVIYDLKAVLPAEMTSMRL
ncbi:MAG: nucleotide sugar dehydrogenase [Rhodobacteraceae bacterium]|nr:nucleotide sugar dehydrogenase [Paracoccaceae bacterium]